MGSLSKGVFERRMSTGSENFPVLIKKKKALYSSVNVFSTKVLIGDTIFMSPTGDRTAISRGHPSHARVSLLAVQSKCLHFSVILRPWLLVRTRGSNPLPPALQSQALPTEPTLPRWKKIYARFLTQSLKRNIAVEVKMYQVRLTLIF